jgi:ABC-type branched-subunit amino acid transport system substrate-binding protein
MHRSLWMRRVAAATALALAVSACGNGDGDEPETADDGVEEPADDVEEDAEPEDGEEPETDDEEGETAEGDGVLSFGYVLPETGDLAFLGPPQIEAVALAIADINEAGGVLGEDVPEAVAGDEAGDAGVASENAQQVLSQGVDAIIGAAASGMSLAFVDAVTGAGVLQCSGSNTAPTFTVNDYGGLYSRTAPTDALQGPVLAELIINDGNAAPALLARADDYGQGLLDAAVEELEASGAQVALAETYDPEAQSFAAEVDSVVSSGADSVVLISFEEGAQILSEMVEAGVSPADIPVYGADGLAGDDLATTVDPNDPSILEGMKGTRPSPEANPDFLDRFQEESGLSDTTFAPQVYDCVTIIALAAELAGSDAPAEIAPLMVDVTSEGGTECSDFAECKEAIEGGDEITYAATSGVVLTETENGTIEPESGLYEIYEFDGEGAVVGVEQVESNF